MQNMHARLILKNFGIATLVVLGVFAAVTLLPMLPNALVFNTPPKNKENPPENKERNRTSVVVINTGSTYYCGQAGVAKTRDYLNKLLADGWSIESSEASTFASTQYGYNKGNTCSFSYYVLKK